MVGEHERLVDEAADEVGHVAGGDDARVCADDLGRVQRRPTAERRQPPEHDLFGRLEEVVAPVDQAAQRLLAGLDPAAAAGEEREAVVEASGDVDEREGAQPGRGELDGERQPVEALDQLHGEGLLLRPDREVGPDRGGSRRQEVQGLVAGQRGIAHETSPGTAGGSRLVASTYSPGHWARRVATSSAAASMTCSQLSSTTSADRRGRPRAGRARRRRRCPSVPVGHAERPRHLGHDGGARRQRCQLDERRRAGRVVGDEPAGQLDGDRGLARHPARPA